MEKVSLFLIHYQQQYSQYALNALKSIYFWHLTITNLHLTIFPKEMTINTFKHVCAVKIIRVLFMIIANRTQPYYIQFTGKRLSGLWTHISLVKYYIDFQSHYSNEILIYENAKRLMICCWVKKADYRRMSSMKSFLTTCLLISLSILLYSVHILHIKCCRYAKNADCV